MARRGSLSCRQQLLGMTTFFPPLRFLSFILYFFLLWSCSILVYFFFSFFAYRAPYFPPGIPRIFSQTLAFAGVVLHLWAIELAIIAFVSTSAILCVIVIFNFRDWPCFFSFVTKCVWSSP
jgi:hypothetical protein